MDSVDADQTKAVRKLAECKEMENMKNERKWTA